MAIAFLVILLMAYILTKNIIYPLNNIKDLARRLSRYDFSETMIITRKDEFGQTGVALNTAQENVSSLIKVIMEKMGTAYITVVRYRLRFQKRTP